MNLPDIRPLILAASHPHAANPGSVRLLLRRVGEAIGRFKMIRDAVGKIPLVGIYANGEISNSRLYGYTGVLTLFL